MIIVVVLAGTDDPFSLLAFNDPVLHETLAEIHDKNMFDEHLGLKKEIQEEVSSEQTSDVSQPNQEPSISVLTNTSLEGQLSGINASACIPCLCFNIWHCYGVAIK